MNTSPIKILQNQKENYKEDYKHALKSLENIEEKKRKILEEVDELNKMFTEIDEAIEQLSSKKEEQILIDGNKISERIYSGETINEF